MSHEEIQRQTALRVKRVSAFALLLAFSPLARINLSRVLQARQSRDTSPFTYVKVPSDAA